MNSSEREQSKWLYGALTGFCAVFFLSLFSFYANNDVTPSPFLIISITCFSASLPVFAGCTIVHVAMVEDKISDHAAAEALGDRFSKKSNICGFNDFHHRIIVTNF